MSRAWIPITIVALLVAGFVAWLLLHDSSPTSTSRTPASSSQRPSSAAPDAKSSRLRDTTTTRPDTALDLTLTLESLAGSPTAPRIRLYLKPNDRKPDAPKAGTLTSLSPGLNRVDLSDFPDGNHPLTLVSDDYIPQWFYVAIQDHAIKSPLVEITLYRKRYVTFRYAYNDTSALELTGPKIKTGRAVLSHFGRLPFFGNDWMLWQSANGYSPHNNQGGGSKDDMFGDTPMLEPFRISSDIGFLAAPENSNFDDLKEAPETGYSPDAIQATSGLVLFCRVSGNRNKPPDSGYGKILIESVSTTRPSGLTIIEPKYP